MDLVQLLFLIALIAVLVWGLLHFFPMPEPFPRIIIAVAVIAIVFFLLTSFDLIPENVLPNRTN